ncbi:ABC transporter permease [Pseudolabrys taiwanensis]|uniref:ABC transporter permease n=1 Tax=Pseudolabrys taiwanensis TaxID=331696 RepID=A0A345ZXB8_9HYPH|nr:ABC transporter permease [Pseudolabrys taiwanensis]AXK81565.1 ABC transporter permease [Pseudolabrys taiwanensis]
MTLALHHQARRPSPILQLDALKKIVAPLGGIAIIVGIWWLGGLVIQATPRLSAFHGFTVANTSRALWALVASGDALKATVPSLSRVLQGLIWAFVIGTPIGLAVGRWRLLESLLQFPFQFLRMISPLAWMPIAILMFPSWNGAIVFLIAVASIWPIIFSTAAGVKRIDPVWLAMASNLGGRPLSVLRRVIFPAVARDIFGGLRLALGVAWIVLVPAEFLGVTSGLGYAINDARDTLSYDRLGAIVILIGVIGFALDAVLASCIRRTQWTPTA